VDFNPKLVRRDNENHFILIKGVVTIASLYTPEVGTPNFIKHTLLELKTQIDPNTMVVRDFQALSSPIHRSSRQKSTKKLSN
jgi:hypothetical protein